MSVALEPDALAMREMAVESQKDNNFGISRMSDTEGTTVYNGKESEAVYVYDLNGNLAANNSRQVFAKEAGVNVFETENTGVMNGIGGRGLDPSRVSNFSSRQNGYDISADPLGYPDVLYTPPVEALERIEGLRGVSAMQFGSQFGGLLNYKLKDASSKKLSGNFRETTGSYGFINSFNQVSGSVGRFSYNLFYQYKHSDGWRLRSEMTNHAAFGSFRYQLSEKIILKAEYTLMDYVTQQPGGLTDSLYKDDYTQAMRSRNWTRVNWNLLSLSADYKINGSTRMSLTSFGLIAGKDALGVLQRPDQKEDTALNRNLLRDKYRNFGVELRLLKRYNLLGSSSNFLIGGRYYNGNANREQGDADKTNKAHFNFLNPDSLQNSYTFPSQNYAIFLENIFQVTKNWNVTPAARYEYVSTASQGYYRFGDTLSVYDQTAQDNRQNARSYFLAGIGSQFKLGKYIEVYANVNQNYRTTSYNNMRLLNPAFQVNPNLKDENGYTADLGFKAVIKNVLYVNMSLFWTQFNNRIGTTLLADSMTGQTVLYRTNIGNSRNAGAEIFAELDWIKLMQKNSRHRLSTFVNASYVDAVYQTPGSIYNNKKVEFVPNLLIKAGLTYGYKKFSLTYQYSYVSKQYSDATNAESSTVGIYGRIPAYTVMDLSLNYQLKQMGISAGINNIGNTKYFTQRSDLGILPGNPIGFYVTIGVRF